MRLLRTLVACAGASLTACGGASSPGPDPAGFSIAAIAHADLPCIGSVGDAPSPARSVTVAATADGTIITRDGPTDLEGLRNHLKDAADRAPRHPDGASRLYVVLRVHRQTPWAVACWLLQACADPAVKAYRTAFAVRAEEDDSEGSILCELPMDHGCGQSIAEPALPIRVSIGGAAFDPNAFFADARWHFSRHTECYGADLEVPPRMPTGTALTMVDLLRRAGARRVLFTGVAVPKADPSLPPPPGRTLVQEWVARNPVLDGGWRVVLGDFQVATAVEDPTPPSVARVRGALVSLPPWPKEDEWTAADVPKSTLASPLVGDSTLFEEEELPPQPEETEQVHTPDEVTQAEVMPPAPKEPTIREPIPEEPDLPPEEEIDPAVPARTPATDFEKGLPWRRGPRGWAIENALECLAANQREDGSWGSDLAATGLAVLAHVAAGDRGKAPSRGLARLVALHGEDGRVGDGSARLGHAIATTALVWAAAGDDALRPAAQRALDALAAEVEGIAARTRPDALDVAVEAWAALAFVRASTVPDRLTVPTRTVALLVARLADLPTRAADGTEFPAGTPSTRLVLASVAAFARGFLSGDPRDAPRPESAPKFATWPSGEADYAGAFFGGLLARQSGGDARRDFRAAAVAALLSRQRADRAAQALYGSFAPHGVGIESDPVASTALGALALLADDLFPLRFPAR